MRAYIASKWQQFTHWAAYRAWEYARRREYARRVFMGAPPEVAEDDLTPDQRRIRSNEARQVLENRHFREAWSALSQYVEAQADGCDPDNKDKAARIIVTKQLMTGFRRELERKLEDGYMAEVEIAELEAKRRLRRFIR